MSTQSWLESIREENRNFTEKVNAEDLPTARAPGPAVITCMDPRVNLAAIGIPGFAEDGSNDSAVRIIRAIGAMAEERSLIVGMFLANISELVVLMHTDCGCCLAHKNIDVIIGRMEERLPAEQFDSFKQKIGEPFRENLLAHLKAFEDPFEAVEKEVASIKALPYAPDNLVIHGLVYTLETGKAEVVVDGYA